MNETRVKAFCSAFQTALASEALKNPSGYFLQGMSPADYAATFAKKVEATILGGNPGAVTYSTVSFKAACKAVGIKTTRKAIFEYFESV